MISILHFSNTHARGGVEEHILSLLHGLDRKYFRLHLACSPAVAREILRDLPADVELIPMELDRVTQFGAMLGLARVLRRRRIDILHSHMFQSSLFASPIGWLCRVPVIVETPHIREQWRRGWLKGSFFIDRCIGRMLNYYIAVSAANAGYLAGTKGLPKEKIVTIVPGSKVSRFDPGRPAPVDWKTKLGFGETDPLLVVVGRLEPQKGHRVLLEAMPFILRRFPKTRLVCLSDGSLRAELEQYVMDRGLNESVRFVGYQPDVRDWLALADVSVLPSFYEGLPLAAIEAMAAGRAVVASAVDGTPEVVLDGKTGFTVPPGDPAKLADAICRLLADPELRTRMERAGRQWVEENFSEERLIQRTQDFYLQAMERRLSHAARLPFNGAVTSLDGPGAAPGNN